MGVQLPFYGYINRPSRTAVMTNRILSERKELKKFASHAYQDIRDREIAKVEEPKAKLVQLMTDPALSAIKRQNIAAKLLVIANQTSALHAEFQVLEQDFEVREETDAPVRKDLLALLDKRGESGTIVIPSLSQLRQEESVTDELYEAIQRILSESIPVVVLNHGESNQFSHENLARQGMVGAIIENTLAVHVVLSRAGGSQTGLRKKDGVPQSTKNKK